MFFESYVLAVEAAYDAYIKIAEGNVNAAPGSGDSRIEPFLRNEYGKWLNTPLEMLGNMTPSDYLETVTDLEQLTDMFIYGAAACDDELPENFIDKLYSFGEEAVGVLLEIAAGSQCGESGESFLAPVMAVKVLGKWKAARAVEPLIKLLYAEGEAYELLYETIRDALVSIGAPALDAVLDALDQTVRFSEYKSIAAAEYLIMALAQIGHTNRSERIYKSLKRAFTQIPQKIVASECLADYGDGRAVPFLRGYLEKAGSSADRETYFEIVSAVRRLGGRTDDLNFRKA